MNINLDKQGAFFFLVLMFANQQGICFILLFKREIKFQQNKRKGLKGSLESNQGCSYSPNKQDKILKKKR